MSPRSFVAVAATSLLLSLLAARPVGTCWCSKSGPSCEAAWSADAVFVAQVIGIERVPEPVRTAPRPEGVFVVEVIGGGGPPARVRVKNLELFNGKIGAEVDILASGGDCGYSFTVGMTYLVYANRSADGELRTSGCSRTRRIEQAEDDLAYLRAVQRLSPDVGWVEGTVTIANAPGDKLEPAGGVRVSATSDTATFSDESAADGRYRIEVPPGRYRFAVTPPDGFYSGPVDGETLDVKRGAACADRPVSLYADGRLTGRVVDSNGVPVPYFGVFAVEASRRTAEFWGKVAVTNADGIYELTGVRPGRHLLGTGMATRAGAPGNQRLWHPGVRDENRASIINIRPSERRTLPDLTLTPNDHLITLTVRVTDKSGLPVAGAMVYIFDELPGEASRSSIAGPPMKTDADGVYRLSTYIGRYTASAEKRDEDQRQRRQEIEAFDALQSDRVDIVLPD